MTYITREGQRNGTCPKPVVKISKEKKLTAPRLIKEELNLPPSENMIPVEPEHRNPVPPLLRDLLEYFPNPQLGTEKLPIDEGYLDLFYGLVSITPQLAAFLIGDYFFKVRQRNISTKHTDFILDMQKSEDGIRSFRFGSDITFGCYETENGSDYFAIVDGNHTLTALSRGKEAITFMVKCYRMKDANSLGRLYNTYNNDKAKTPSELTSLMEPIYSDTLLPATLKNNALGMALDLNANFRYYSSANQRMDINDKFAVAKHYAKATEMFYRIVYKNNSGNKDVRKKLKGKYFQIAATQLLHFKPVMAERFLAAVIEFNSIDDCDDARRTFAEFILKIQNTHQFTSPEYALHLLFDAWNAWVKNERLQVNLNNVEATLRAFDKEKDVVVHKTTINTRKRKYCLKTNEWVPFNY